MPLRSDSLTIDSPEVIKSFYPDMSIPSNVRLSFEFQGDKMKITSRVGDDIEISGLLEKASLNFRSVLDATDMTWSDFKNFVLENHDGHIYRGQNLPWKLSSRLPVMELYPSSKLVRGCTKIVTHLQGGSYI